MYALPPPLPPLPPSPPRVRREPVPIEYIGADARKKAQYSANLVHGECVLVTKNAKGRASDNELAGKLYKVYAPDGVFRGFLDPDTNRVYCNPSKLSQTHLPPRNGSTNEWDGPSHVLVRRQNAWMQIKMLN